MIEIICNEENSDKSKQLRTIILQTHRQAYFSEKARLMVMKNVFLLRE